MQWKQGALALVISASPVLALGETYNFEIGIAAVGDRYESTSVSDFAFSPFPVVTSLDLDNDEIGVAGSWYFAGLSDDNGPRSRAAFVDRASSLSFAYARGTLSADFAVASDDPAFSPIVQPIPDVDSDLFAANLRMVSRSSGWFGQFGIAQTTVESSSPSLIDVDATSYSVGGGYYFLDTTALALDLIEVDADSPGALPAGDATTWALSFAHLGPLGERWQYAVDLNYSRTDGDFDSTGWRAAFALFPTKDVEFGIAIDESEALATPGSDRTGFEGFVSWFITPNFEVAGSYRVDDVDAPFGSINGGPVEGSADQYGFSLGATLRF